MMSRLLPAAGCALVLLGAGCAQLPLEEQPGDPQFAPLAAAQPTPDFRSQGAVQYASFASSLFSDRRAMQVGDIITVHLSERTQASKDADNSITKDQTIDVGTGTIMGNTMPIGDVDLTTNLDATRDFEGKAKASQNNSLSGSISVTVTEVLPNGLLRVRGEKWLQLNRGSEYIRLSGMVRQQDISPDNSVASTKLADARISYSGTGEFAQSNNMGWLAKIFNHGWWPL